MFAVELDTHLAIHAAREEAHPLTPYPWHRFDPLTQERRTREAEILAEYELDPSGATKAHEERLQNNNNRFQALVEDRGEIARDILPAHEHPLAAMVRVALEIDAIKNHCPTPTMPTILVPEQVRVTYKPTSITTTPADTQGRSHIWAVPRERYYAIPADNRDEPPSLGERCFFGLIFAIADRYFQQPQALFGQEQETSTPELQTTNLPAVVIQNGIRFSQLLDAAEGKLPSTLK